MSQDDIFVDYVQKGGSKKISPMPSTSASIYGIGTKKTGRDGNIWKVISNKDVKQWEMSRSKTKTKTKSKTKSKNKNKKRSVLDYYNVVYIGTTDLKNMMHKFEPDEVRTINNIFVLVDAIRKLEIISHIIPLCLSDNGRYWNDYPGSYMSEIYSDRWLDNPNGYMYFTIYMNQSGTAVTHEEGVSVSYSNMNKEKKIKIIKLFDKYLPKQYKWTGKNTEKIMIYYEPQKDFKHPVMTSLKDDDVYPLMILNIQMKKSINLLKDENKHIVVEYLEDLKKLIGLKDDDFVNFSYGMSDITYEFYTISNAVYKNSSNKIKKYLDSQKDQVSKHTIQYMKRDE